MHQESAYKVIFLAQLIYLLSISPIFDRYFSHLNYGGLVFQGFLSNFLSKGRVRIIYVTWVVCLILSFSYSGGIAFTCSLICLALSRYFFITLRYNCVGRGNGAPGFMSYWSMLYATIFQFLEFKSVSAGALILLLNADFGIIMLSASYYKYKNGYLHGRGIEFGLKNEMWSWAHRSFLRIPNNSLVFKTLNFLSVAVELLVAIFLFLPGFHKVAAVLLALMFVFLLIFVRLGTLPLTMLALSYVIFATDDVAQSSSSPTLLKAFCIFYALIITLGTAWNWIFYFKLRVPKTIELLLKNSYRISGCIIWSVFTARLTENLIRVYKVDNLMKYELKPIDYGVHSGISLTTIATYTDYFPGAMEEQEKRFKIYLEAIYGRTSDLELHFYKNRLDGDTLKSEPIKTFRFN